MIGLCCDSGAQLPPSLAPSSLIEVVPLTVTIDGVEYREGVDITADEFWEAFADGRRPEVSTAAPSPGSVADAYRRLQACDATEIVSVHTGSEISGTFNAARLAVDLVDVPVELVDTGSASFVVGLATLAAAEHLAGDGTAAGAAECARGVAGSCGNVFVVGALDLARSSGRLSPEATVSSSPDAVPVLRLRDGAMTTIGEANSVDDAARTMVAEILASGDRLRVGVGVADESSQGIAAALRDLLRAADVEIIDYRVGPSVGAHTGPGTAGAVYHPIG